MTFDELLINRRSVRKYLDRSVPVDLIRTIIEESTLAPSAGNEQPWKFIIVSDREMLLAISEECKQNLLSRIKANPGDYASKYQGMLQKKSFNIFYNAPCLVMILGLAHLKNVYVDCALAASYFMMSAASRGLGTCWVNFATEIHNKQMNHALGIPENCKIVAPVIMGYPATIPPAPRRNQPEILKTIP